MALSKTRRFKMLSAKDMKTLIDEIIHFNNELRKYHEFEDEPARAHSAAKKNVLDSFAARYEKKIPPSYLQLLSIYNGIDNFEWVDVSILPIEFLMKHDKLEKHWVDSDAYDEGELFIFAQSSSDSHVVAFLTKTRDKNGEMEIAHFDGGGSLGRYTNLDEYLRERRDWYKKSVALEKEDRKGLADE
jgi:hypothetical protein